MTVQDMIDHLTNVTDKSAPLSIRDTSGKIKVTNMYLSDGVMDFGKEEPTKEVVIYIMDDIE